MLAGAGCSENRAIQAGVPEGTGNIRTSHCLPVTLLLQGRVWGGFGRKEEAVGRLDFTEGQAPGAAANGNGTAEDLGSSLIDAPEEEYEPVDDEPVGQVGGCGSSCRCWQPTDGTAGT